MKTPGTHLNIVCARRSVVATMYFLYVVTVANILQTSDKGSNINVFRFVRHNIFVIIVIVQGYKSYQNQYSLTTPLYFDVIDTVLQYKGNNPLI